MICLKLGLIHTNESSKNNMKEIKFLKSSKSDHFLIQHPAVSKEFIHFF